MFKNFFLIFSFCISSCFSNQYELSICTIFRDEAPYLKEWIEYHRMLGVEHFYLCSHASKDNYREVLDPYIIEGIVDLQENGSEPNANVHSLCFGIQNSYYNQILSRDRGLSKWIAFIDSDEFLVPIKNDSIVNMLNDYESFGSIKVYWLMFGTSGVQKLRSDQLTIEQLTKCAQKDHQSCAVYKTIVKPSQANYFLGTNDVCLLEGSSCMHLAIDDMRINHYWCRDEDYFWNVKVPRHIQIFGTTDGATRYYEDLNKDSDYNIQRFVPELRKRMGLD
jgi:hypothetical protein